MKETLLILIGAAITTIVALITKRSKQKKQINLLTSELVDLIRHSIVNLEILKAIDLSKGIPSNMHFEKMKIMDSSILFAPDTYSIINSKYTGDVNRLKLEIRNINIELDSILSLKKNDTIHTSELDSYISYLISRMDYRIEKTLPERLRKLKISDKLHLKISKQVNEYKKHYRKSEIKIIYE